jgi:hypothetical protein
MDNKNVEDLLNVFRGEKPIIVDIEPMAYFKLAGSVAMGMFLAVLLAAVITKK